MLHQVAMTQALAEVGAPNLGARPGSIRRGTLIQSFGRRANLDNDARRATVENNKGERE
jgi:hypothetical protein